MSSSSNRKDENYSKKVMKPYKSDKAYLLIANENEDNDTQSEAGSLASNDNGEEIVNRVSDSSSLRERSLQSAIDSLFNQAMIKINNAEAQIPDSDHPLHIAALQVISVVKDNLRNLYDQNAKRFEFYLSLRLEFFKLTTDRLAELAENTAQMACYSLNRENLNITHAANDRDLIRYAQAYMAQGSWSYSTTEKVSYVFILVAIVDTLSVLGFHFKDQLDLNHLNESIIASGMGLFTLLSSIYIAHTLWHRDQNIPDFVRRFSQEFLKFHGVTTTHSFILFSAPKSPQKSTSPENMVQIEMDDNTLRLNDC